MREHWSSMGVCKLMESLEGKLLGEGTPQCLAIPPRAPLCSCCPRGWHWGVRRRGAGTDHAVGNIPSASNTHQKGLSPPVTDIWLLKSDFYCFELTRSPAIICVSRNVCTHVWTNWKSAVIIFCRRHFAAQNKLLNPFASAFTSVYWSNTSVLLHWECGCWAASGQARVVPQFPWLTLGKLLLFVYLASLSLNQR